MARRRRTFFAAALPVAIPLILAAVAIEPTQSASPRGAMEMSLLPLRYDALSPQAPAQLPEHSVILTIEEDDTLDGVLVAGGLSRRDSALLTNEFARSIDVRRIRPGNMIRFHFASPEKIDAVQLRVSGWGSVDAERNADSRFTVKPRPSNGKKAASGK